MSRLANVQATWFMRIWGFFKVPLIFWAWPKIVKISDETVEVVIPLRRFTKNHLNCMYISLLVTGADVAGGILVFRLMREKKGKLSLIFKDLKANFIKRAESHTHFICNDGAKIRALVDNALASGKRVNDTVKIRAVCPAKTGDETIAEFELTLSVKPK